MRSFLLALVLAFSWISAPQAQPAPGGAALTAEQIEAAKNAGNAIASMGRTRSIQVDETGALVRDPTTGAPLENRGETDAAAQLRYLQGLTGIETTQTEGRSGKGGAGNARISARAFADFRCPMQAGTRTAAGGQVIWLQACAMQSQRVASVTLRLCDAIARGGVCDTASFGEAVTIASGQYAQLVDTTIGVGCNDATNACRITLSSSLAISGQGTALTQQASEAQTNAGANSAQAALTQIATDPNYGARMTQWGTELNECVQRNLATLGEEGAVRTCDQQQQIRFAGAATNASGECDTARQCIREVARELKYTRSCQRTIPLTNRSCSYEIPKLTCHVTETLGHTTNSCTPESLEGAQPVGKSERKCLTPADSEGGMSCSHFSWDEFYVFPDKAKELTCETSPSPLAGPFGPAICDVSGSGREETCEPGGWFGRTKSDDQCRAQAEDFAGGLDLSVNNGKEGEGCGVCVRPRVSYTCYAQPTEDNPADSCQGIDLANCSLKDAYVISTTEGGLVTAQRETFECSREQRYCAEWSQTPQSAACQAADMTYGLEHGRFKAPGSDGSLNQALATAAVLNAIAQNTTDGDLPLIFDGEDMRCQKPTGGLFGSLYMDCCRINLQRPSAKTGKLNKCSLNEAKLAAARRAQYDVYIGDYCSKKMRFPSKCIMRKQTYCVYQGILPRLIHEQGRQQLAEIVASSNAADIERSRLTFDYYSPGGGWTAPTVVNGTRITAWQYPTYCADPATAEKRQQEDPYAVECPARLVQWFATCANPAGCGPLPEAPEMGSDTWTIQDTDPLRNVTTTLSSVAVARGACDPATSRCDYEVSAWPAGIGGRAMVHRDVTFEMYADVSEGDIEYQNIGDFVFQGLPLSGAAQPGKLPPAVGLRYSVDGGQTWQTTQVPTALAGEMRLPATDIVIQGGCLAEANTCSYRVTGPMEVHAKPWGSPKAPDCSGFTAGQLSALDFSRMDLTEWLATVIDKVSAQSPQALVDAAQSQFQTFNAVFQSTGQVKASAPQGQQIARVTPAEGFGPFEVVLDVAGAWPPFDGNPLDNPNKITGVVVDWGDCSLPETLAPVIGANGQPAGGYRARHVYPGPDEIPPPCGPLERNVTHHITLTLHTLESGVQTRALEVVNAWATMPGHASSGRERNAAIGGDELVAPRPR